MYASTTTNTTYTTSRPLAGQRLQDAPAGVPSGPPGGDRPPINYMSSSPRRRGPLSPDTLLTIAPQQQKPLRDWEGFALQAEQQARSPLNPSASFNRNNQPGTPKTPTGYAPPVVKREGSPSVATLREANERGVENYQRLKKQQEMQNAPRDLRDVPYSPYHGTPRNTMNEVPERQAALLDHQGFLAWKRDEFQRRQEAEARGEVYTPRQYNGGNNSYLMQNGDLSRGGGGNQANITPRGMEIVGSDGTRRNIDFTGRRRDLPVQVLATHDELAWLKPPPIPDPIGWNGFWDLCAGHELILQHMAVSGANPQNSPSLTEHFMYPELISCFQRLTVGTYLIRYQGVGEPPHERYFYIKSLPLANKAQYAPFLCWSQHKNSHNAMDAIPLVNVIWVTQGMHSPNFRKYYLGGNAIKGPFVGKHKIEALAYGCFTVWYYNGSEMRGLDLLATDPLVFTIWMKMLEDISHLNAAVDTSGKVRKMQRHIENLREDGLLMEYGIQGEKKQSFFSQFNLSG